ncbi:MAG: efflux RND transporter periplasmic adaptor subunit [Acidobacteriia bacterium]|nr:efflux RND transporter periplasmic adaptor subunit [Terriglobia bacterium]
MLAAEIDCAGKARLWTLAWLLVATPILLACAACSSAHGNQLGEAPPPVKVVPDVNVNLFSVDHPEQFPLTEAVPHSAASQLVVTGSVNPDIARSVPVVSLATGRVVAIHARLGDTVKKGQTLLSIRSDDVGSGFSDYRKAVADEVLARTQLERATDLYNHGALSQNDLQIAQDTEDKAKVDVETTEEHLRLLGNDPSKPKGIVDIDAPISGVITDQQVTNAGGVQGLGSSPFTITDLSYVWVVCDVYENDLPNVRIGETAEIKINAYPNEAFTGKISNIGALLDSTIRTAKVRVEVRNPGMMRPGMFATATFTGLKKQTHTLVPSTAILRIHDRDWVYVPAPDNRFRRAEVVSGDITAGNNQEIISGIAPGQKVVSNALALERTISQ